MFLTVIGQGAQKEINREAQTAWRRRLEQMQYSVQNGHVLVGGNNINAVWLDPHSIFDLKNLHRGGALKQFVHHTLVGRIQMLDDDKSDAAVCGNMPQELFDGFQSACGRTDTGYGKKKIFLGPRQCIFW